MAITTPVSHLLEQTTGAPKGPRLRHVLGAVRPAAAVESQADAGGLMIIPSPAYGRGPA